MRPRQFTDERLLSVARHCFLKHGAGVPTSQIADELGVSQAALFKRCGTKRALMIQALMPPKCPPWIGVVEAGPNDEPVPDQLRTVIERIDAYFEQMLPAITVLRAAKIQPEEMLTARGVPPPVVAHRALTGWFRRLHEQGRAVVPHPLSTAMAFLGAIHARHMLCHTLGPHAPQTEPQFLHNLVDVFWTGIAPGSHHADVGAPPTTPSTEDDERSVEVSA